MSSPALPTTTTIPRTDLAASLAALGLRSTANHLPDLLARATKHRWSGTSLLEELARIEAADRAQRSLDRRLVRSRIGRFKPMADFDWTWPKKIDRDLIERALSLDFLPERRNFAIIANNGLGKTMIAKNVAHAALLAGHSVLFRTASDLLADLAADSPELRRRRFNFYARHDLLVVDEIGYLSYDDRAADLLFEIVSRRYERRSILVTTNTVFKDWNTIFPNAAVLGTLLDRLLHHADATLIEGKSYRAFESEREAAARRAKR
jgi:DNA replication protein DnaC